MANWRKTIRIKHLFTENEDYESLQKSMASIGEVLISHPEFEYLDYEEINNLPGKRTLAVANDILNEIYNISDAELIWIE